MNVTLETATEAPRVPRPPARAERLRQLLRLAARALPIPDGDRWSANPSFGDPPHGVRQEIVEAVAFVRCPAMKTMERRPIAAFDWLNRLGTYRGAFYLDVRRDGPRRLDETNGPYSATWQEPVHRPVREALTRPGHAIGNHLAAYAQLGVDAGIGLAAVVRLVGLLATGQRERASSYIHAHIEHLVALASVLGMALLLGGMVRAA